MMAHSGFFKAYSSIRPTLLQLLSSDDDNNIGTYDRLWFTGHSLGAALATLAVVDVGSLMNDTINPITIAPSTVSTSSSSSRTIPSELRFNLPKVRVSSYLFGTPRVGNLAFASRLARLQQRRIPSSKSIIESTRPAMRWCIFHVERWPIGSTLTMFMRARVYSCLLLHFPSIWRRMATTVAVLEQKKGTTTCLMIQHPDNKRGLMEVTANG